MTRRFYWDTEAKDWVPYEERQPRRLVGKGPMVISDNLDSVLNHVDGKRYDSKSAYYKAVRHAGCEIIGNEKVEPKRREYQPQNVEQDIARAYQEVSSRG